jgi:hypothetical protein
MLLEFHIDLLPRLNIHDGKRSAALADTVHLNSVPGVFNGLFISGPMGSPLMTANCFDQTIPATRERLVLRLGLGVLLLMLLEFHIDLLPRLNIHDGFLGRWVLR